LAETRLRDLELPAQSGGLCPPVARIERHRTIVRLVLRGSLTMRQKARLDAALEHARDLCAAVEVWDRHSDLAVLPDDGDLADLPLSGFAKAAADRLRAQAAAGDAAARDALGLLVQLARVGA
jgi:hypothetical protein